MVGVIIGVVEELFACASSPHQLKLTKLGSIFCILGSKTIFSCENFSKPKLGDEVGVSPFESEIQPKNSCQSLPLKDRKREKPRLHSEV